jgi:hypothetical protein
MRDSAVSSYTRARVIAGSKTWFQKEDSDGGGEEIPSTRTATFDMMIQISVVVLRIYCEIQLHGGSIRLDIDLLRRASPDRETDIVGEAACS